MDIVGDRKFVEIPGEQTLDLPPLLVSDAPSVKRLNRVVNLASKVVESEDLVPLLAADHLPSDLELERRRYDMAINMVDMYLALCRQWHWGDGILEWIRQCEITFEAKSELKRLLRPDIWPHAGRSSFVTLIEDKHIPTDGVDVERAVGLRLTFRRFPPLSDFSDQFLFYLNSKLSSTAFQAWSQMSPAPISALPPERFAFQVVTM